MLVPMVNFTKSWIKNAEHRLRCSVLEDHRWSCCKWQPALKLISNGPSKLILREFKGGGGTKAGKDTEQEKKKKTN
jgi:hypothetical protein